MKLASPKPQCPWPWGFLSGEYRPPENALCLCSLFFARACAAASDQSQNLQGPVGRDCSGERTHLLVNWGWGGRDVGTVLPQLLFASRWACWGLGPVGSLWVWSVAGAAEGPLDSKGSRSKRRTMFCLRPRVGSEGRLQGLCPGQPGALATGRVLLAGYSVMWFDTHSSPD